MPLYEAIVGTLQDTNFWLALFAVLLLIYLAVRKTMTEPLWTGDYYVLVKDDNVPVISQSYGSLKFIMDKQGSNLNGNVTSFAEQGYMIEVRSLNEVRSYIQKWNEEVIEGDEDLSASYAVRRTQRDMEELQKKGIFSFMGLYSVETGSSIHCDLRV